jgi:hypothetical protein
LFVGRHAKIRTKKVDTSKLTTSRVMMIGQSNSYLCDASNSFSKRFELKLILMEQKKIRQSISVEIDVLFDK